MNITKKLKDNASKENEKPAEVQKTSAAPSNPPIDPDDKNKNKGSKKSETNKDKQKTEDSRAMPKYGEGEFWDSLKTKKQDQSLIKLIKKSRNKEEIRTDGKGHYYQFDNFHKEHDVHLHEYIKKGNDAIPINEIDPTDGHIICPMKGIAEHWF
jgi:hypothetical protein